MTDVEKVMYILRTTLHTLPNDATLRRIAERIVEAVLDND